MKYLTGLDWLALIGKHVLSRMESTGKTTRFFLLFLFITQSVFAYELSTPVYILPEGKTFVALKLLTKTYTFDQYKTNGDLALSSDTQFMISTLVFRKTVNDRLEIFVEMPMADRDTEIQQPGKLPFYKFDGSDICDTRARITYQIKNGKKESFGLNGVFEWRIPTGDQEKGLGTGAHDFMAYVLVSKKYKKGTLYTLGGGLFTGEGNVNGIPTDNSDELFFSLGFLSHTTGQFFYNLKASYYIQTEDALNQSNGVPVVLEKTHYPGFRMELNYRWSKKLTVMFLHESFFLQNQDLDKNGIELYRESGNLNKTGLVFKYVW